MGLTHSGNIVTNGLVLCLDAANRRSYPGTGTTWYDLSGNNNHGTLINGPTFNSSNDGSIVFDGYDDYVSITENANMTPSTLTVDFVFKINSNTNTVYSSCPSNLQYIFFRQNSRTGQFEGYTGHYDETNGTINIGASTSTGTQYGVATLSNSIELNKNYICTAIWKQSTMDVYLNGVFHNTAAKGTNIDYNSNHTLKFGRTIPNGASWDGAFNGNIFSFKLYNRVLSPQEIKQNYNATRKRFGL